jgi:hypothetical protein
MKIEIFKPLLDELRFGLPEIYLALGYHHKNIPDHIIQLVNETLQQIPEDYCAIGGYCIYDSIKIENSKVQVNNKYLAVNKIIAAQMRQSEKLAIFTCTIGDKIEKRSREYFDKGEFPKGYILDTLGSVLVEAAMDIIQDKLKQDMAHHGLKITNRYSPGYCRWDVIEQHILFSLLPAKFCGISLNESALMTPIKSVSGIIGIGKNVEKRAYPCHICKEKDCPYRNLRKT